MEEKKEKSVETRSQIRRERTTAEEAKIVQLIVFHLGNEEFGADIDQVGEIIGTVPITSIPDSPDFVRGLVNVRGEIAVAIDLRARFFLPTNGEVESKHIIITEQERSLFGLLVDEVTEVLRISKTEIKSTPELVSRIARAYVSGVIILEDRLIIMLDLKKVLSEEDLAKLAEFGARHPSAKVRQKTLEEGAEMRDQGLSSPTPGSLTAGKESL